MDDSKFFLRSRRVLAWALVALTVIAGLDAATVDAIWPNVVVLFGLSPETAAALHAKLLAAVPLAALLLAIWRTKRPDPRPLAALPGPLRSTPPPVALFGLVLGSALLACQHSLPPRATQVAVLRVVSVAQRYAHGEIERRCPSEAIAQDQGLAQECLSLATSNVAAQTALIAARDLYQAAQAKGDAQAVDAARVQLQARACEIVALFAPAAAPPELGTCPAQ